MKTNNNKKNHKVLNHSLKIKTKTNHKNGARITKYNNLTKIKNKKIMIELKDHEEIKGEM